MKPFRFDLQRVLDWRDQQLRVAKARHAALAAQLVVAEEQLASLRAQRGDAEQHVISQALLDPTVLAGLEAFRGRLLGAERRLRTEQAANERRQALALQECTAARSRCRLLEKLKERRRLQHDQAQRRESENVASELILARWPGRSAQ